MNPAVFSLISEKADKVKEHLPAILKVVLVVVIFVLIFFIGKKVYKSITKTPADEADDDVKKKNLSYQESWYSQNAGVLKEALRGFMGLGTDEISVLRILRNLKNIDDWNMLGTVKK
jgi:hypothetical protein